jgi:hypothetical protein
MLPQHPHSSPLNHDFLDRHGLNLQAVFTIADLPPDITDSIRLATNNADSYRQLILLAHGGRTLWQVMNETGIESDNPVDDFSIQIAERFFSEQHPENKYEMIYPGEHPIGLQQLGKLAGWHHDSPFKVGINTTWGTWFAYRVVILADTDFEITTAIQTQSPCEQCSDKPCIDICPANALEKSTLGKSALENSTLNLASCISYRKQQNSNCKNKCLARLRCPVAPEHRYSNEQVNYHYGVSMKTIEQYY